MVTTLGLIGRYQDSYKPDIVFIDEAAQACEPEVDCAIGVLNGSQIVLAGDPKQLGPFSSSKVAHDYGYGKLLHFFFNLLHFFLFEETSLLERLMNLNVYQSGNENYITMLTLNFRSHPIVLKIPNELFYFGKLVVSNYFYYYYLINSLDIPRRYYSNIIIIFF